MSVNQKVIPSHPHPLYPALRVAPEVQITGLAGLGFTGDKKRNRGAYVKGDLTVTLQGTPDNDSDMTLTISCAGAKTAGAFVGINFSDLKAAIARVERG
jgi:hypothetical protein